MLIYQSMGYVFSSIRDFNYFVSMKTHNFYNYYIEHSDTITSLCWNPNNNNEFITSSLDSTVIKWRIKENEIQVSKK